MRVAGIGNFINNININKNIGITPAGRQSGKDIFVKSGNIAFRGDVPAEEETSTDLRDLGNKFNNAIRQNDKAKALEMYEKAPGKIEKFLKGSSCVSTSSGTFWHFKNMVSDDFYVKNLFCDFIMKGDAYVPNLNALLVDTPNKALNAVTSAIAKKNPSYFTRGNILLMYDSDDCASAVSEIAKRDPEKLFDALSFNNGDKYFISQYKITPNRGKVFKALYGKDLKRTVALMSVIEQEMLSELDADKSFTGKKAKAFFDALESKEDMVEVNEKLIDFAQKEPDAMYDTLLAYNTKAKDCHINALMQDKNCNYIGLMLYLLKTNPDRFFDMADKTDCLWHAARNNKQIYLDLFEECLMIDAKRTKDLLLKEHEVSISSYEATTTIQECVNNKSFDYTELLKAYYQMAPNEAFEIFNSTVKRKISNPNDKDTNLLTYYVNKKDYMAEGFITYLTNQNLLYVKRLLSPETLMKVSSLGHKRAMAAIRAVEKEVGKLDTETKRIAMAVLDVNKRLAEFKTSQGYKNESFDSAIKNAHKLAVATARYTGGDEFYYSSDMIDGHADLSHPVSPSSKQYPARPSLCVDSPVDRLNSSGLFHPVFG